MPFVSSFDGSQIYCETHGHGTPAIVFVSGFMGIADIWRPLAARLSPHHLCIAHDNRGFGRSSNPPSRSAYSVESHARDIAFLLDALRIDQPVVLVTHSMGGNIASAFALANPRRVAAIVYTGAYYDGAQFGDADAAFSMLTTSGHVPAAVVKLYAGFGLAEGLALEAAKWSPGAREHNAWGLVSFEMGERYSEITVPTMIVQGARDVVSGPACVRPMAEALPDCRVEILEHVNHFPPTEAPEKLGRLIREFLEKLHV